MITLNITKGDYREIDITPPAPSHPQKPARNQSPFQEDPYWRPKDPSECEPLFRQYIEEHCERYPACNSINVELEAEQFYFFYAQSDWMKNGKPIKYLSVYVLKWCSNIIQRNNGITHASNGARLVRRKETIQESVQRLDDALETAAQEREAAKAEGISYIAYKVKHMTDAEFEEMRIIHAELVEDEELSERGLERKISKHADHWELEREETKRHIRNERYTRKAFFKNKSDREYLDYLVTEPEMKEGELFKESIEASKADYAQYLNFKIRNGLSDDSAAWSLLTDKANQGGALLENKSDKFDNPESENLDNDPSDDLTDDETIIADAEILDTQDTTQADETDMTDPGEPTEAPEAPETDVQISEAGTGSPTEAETDLQQDKTDAPTLPEGEPTETKAEADKAAGAGDDSEQAKQDGAARLEARLKELEELRRKAEEHKRLESLCGNAIQKIRHELGQRWLDGTAPHTTETEWMRAIKDPAYMDECNKRMQRETRAAVEEIAGAWLEQGKLTRELYDGVLKYWS